MNYRVLVIWIFCLFSCFIVQNSFAATTGVHQVNQGPFPPDIQAIKKRGVLTVAFYNGDDMPPFFEQNQQGEWSGIEVDLAQMIATQLGVKLVIKPSDTYDGVINLVASDKVDMGMGLLTITPERAMRVKFTNPYYTFHPHLLVNRLQLAEMGWLISDTATQMETTNRSLKLGALESSANVDILEEAFPKAKIVGYPTMNAAMQAVADGQIFAAIGNAPEQVQNWLQEDRTRVLKTGDVEVSDKTVLVGIAVPWDDEDLRQWLNIYLNYIDMNSIKAQLFQKYGEAESDEGAH